MTSAADFVACIEQHRPAWMKIACSFMAFEDAEDVVQDAMFRGWRGLSAFKGEAALSSWMHHILINVIRDRRRKERTHGGVNSHFSMDSNIEITDREGNQNRGAFDRPIAYSDNFAVPEVATRTVLFGQLTRLINENCTVIQRRAIFALGTEGNNVLKIRLARYHGIAKLRKVMARKVAA